MTLTIWYPDTLDAVVRRAWDDVAPTIEDGEYLILGTSARGTIDGAPYYLHSDGRLTADSIARLRAYLGALGVSMSDADGVPAEWTPVPDAPLGEG